MHTKKKPGCAYGREPGLADTSDAHSTAVSVRDNACPRFERCSAPLCPLDRDWRLRSHRRGEPVCGLLLEASKPGAEAVFRCSAAGAVFPEVVRALPAMCASSAHIKRACERASKSGSKMAALLKVRL